MTSGRKVYWTVRGREELKYSTSDIKALPQYISQPLSESQNFKFTQYYGYVQITLTSERSEEAF